MATNVGGSSSGSSSIAYLENDKAAIEREIQAISGQIGRLQEQRRALQDRHSELESQLRKAREVPERAAVDYASDSFSWSLQAEQLLRGPFGLQSWRPNQKEIISATLSGHDTFVVMRTGGGKSLTYQLPALIQGGITVVVSPLVSLIADQVRSFNEVAPGTAAMLTAAQGRTEAVEVYRRMRGEDAGGKGASKGGSSSSGSNGVASGLTTVFVTPEKVEKSKQFMAALDRAAGAERLSRLVVDEAHCCSQWGHDFRPDYTKLGKLKRQFPSVPLLAVTATCTPAIMRDVCSILGVREPVVFRSSFNRANLHYSVRTKPERFDAALAAVAAIIEENGGGGGSGGGGGGGSGGGGGGGGSGGRRGRASGLVYAFSRKEAEQVADGLAAASIRARAYHAGMDDAARASVQEAWQRGDIDVVVATIAFGMGINKLDVRYVIHFSLPRSVEGLYQESGRAGRDGLPSNCVVFYRAADASRQACLSYESPNGITVLRGIVGYCQNHSECRRVLVARALGESTEGVTCGGTCDVCATEAAAADEEDVTERAKALVWIVRSFRRKEERVTVKQLVDSWRSKAGSKKAAVGFEGVGPGGLNREGCERLINHLLNEGVLGDDFHYTAYSVIHYITTGSLASAVENDALSVTMHLTAEYREARANAKPRASSGGTGKAAKEATPKAAAGKNKKKAASAAAAAAAAAPPPPGAAIPAAAAMGASSNGVDALVDLCSSDGEQEEDQEVEWDEPVKGKSSNSIGGGGGGSSGSRSGRGEESNEEELKEDSFDSDDGAFERPKSHKKRKSSFGGGSSGGGGGASGVKQKQQRRLVLEMGAESDGGG